MRVQKRWYNAHNRVHCTIGSIPLRARCVRTREWEWTQRRRHVGVRSRGGRPSLLRCRQGESEGGASSSSCLSSHCRSAGGRGSVVVVVVRERERARASSVSASGQGNEGWTLVVALSSGRVRGHRPPSSCRHRVVEGREGEGVSVSSSGRGRGKSKSEGASSLRAGGCTQGRMVGAVDGRSRSMKHGGAE